MNVDEYADGIVVPSFGPRMVPYYTINKGRLPFELVLKFTKRAQF